MKKKGIICACAASILICNCINASSVSAVDYSFIQKVEPLLYDWEFQQELREDEAIEHGKPDTRWFDPEDQRKEYEISTEEELFGLAELVNARQLDWKVNEIQTFEGITIRLMQDIQLTQAWTSIGTSDSYPFRGTFEGNGHTVSGLDITNSTDDNQGFFGYLGGTVNNLNLTGNITTNGSNSGAVAGTILEGAVVENCTAKVNVTGKDKIGGIVGENKSSSIIKCRSYGHIKGNAKVGGIVGENRNGLVEQCFNEGTVISLGKGVGTYGTGGIAGRSVAMEALIKECYNKGNIFSTNECAGGIVGYTNAAGSTVTDCYNTGAVSGPTTSGYGYVGGIIGSIGENGVSLKNSYNAGIVKNGKYAGGVLGNYSADYYSKIEAFISNNYYLDNSAENAVGKDKEEKGRRSYSKTAVAKSEGDMRSTHMASVLSIAFRSDTDGMHGINNGFPVLRWQEETTIDKAALLKKMDINYKKEFYTFLNKYPYGVCKGGGLVELSNPQLFFDRILKDLENHKERGR